jgi:hypothetical protein
MTDLSLGAAAPNAAAAPTAAAPADEAQQELAAGLARLRRRGTLVATERWLLVAGGILLPLGAALVLAGWYGAAHTTRLFEEIPYLLSGGLFGLVLVITGAAFYFGYWLTRMVSNDRQMLEVMLRIESRLEALPLELNAAQTSERTSAAAPTLVATKTGTMYHRSDCQIVADRSANELRRVRLPAPGMSPCKLCAPLA